MVEALAEVGIRMKLRFAKFDCGARIVIQLSFRNPFWRWDERKGGPRQ